MLFADELLITICLVALRVSKLRADKGRRQKKWYFWMSFGGHLMARNSNLIDAIDSASRKT